MHVSPFVAVAVIGGVTLLASRLWDENKRTGDPKASAKPPLTTLEQAVYWRLVEAFPDRIVLAQVALTALLRTPRKDRDRIHHKVVDFVVLDRAFAVQAIVEVDDESQASRHTIGEPVVALLRLAGYRVFEVTRPPEVADLRRLLDLPATAS